ncbi:hypothetical protein FRB95_011722 [Tulasnella sp. JGI-2019a]|nr:hypothetical protein FRB95_011722 [Tulasnella sp. JGI-2019a]
MPSEHSLFLADFLAQRLEAVRATQALEHSEVNVASNAPTPPTISSGPSFDDDPTRESGIGPQTRRGADQTARGNMYKMTRGRGIGPPRGRGADATPTGSGFGPPIRRDTDKTPTGSMFRMTRGMGADATSQGNIYGLPPLGGFGSPTQKDADVTLTGNGMGADKHLTPHAAAPLHQRSGMDTHDNMPVSHMPVGLQSIQEVPSAAGSVFLSPVLAAAATRPDAAKIVAGIPEVFSLGQVSPELAPAPPLESYSHWFEDHAFLPSDTRSADTNSFTRPDVAAQEAKIDAVFSRSSSGRRRRSESSDGSSASSSFREYSSSPSSGSSSGSGSGGDGERKQDLYPNPSPTSSSAASQMVKQVLNIGKTQRLVRLYVAELGNLHPGAQITAASALLWISKKNDRGRQEVARRLTKGKKNLQSTLKHLFRLADDEAYSSPHYCRLRQTATSAQLIDIVISEFIYAFNTAKLVASMNIYLQDLTVLDGAAGVQYSLERWRYLFQAIPNVEVVLRVYAERVLVDAPHVATSPALAMRLLELMLQGHTIYAKDLSDAALDRIAATLGPSVSHSTPASLHLIRAMDSTPRRILSSEVIDSLMSILTNDSDQLTKRLAFSTLAKLLPDEAIREERVIDLAIDVLLWNTNWQHYSSAQKKELWDDSTNIPHDDAYRIISHIPALNMIPSLKSRFQSNQLALRSEPLLALVVEHSITPDPLWPRTLSSLIQAGIVNFLIRVAQQSLPDDLGHREYRVIHGAKRDALITVVRIFEQIMAKDLHYIGADVPSSLRIIADDTKLPWSVQWQAKTALKWWNRLCGIGKAPSPHSDQHDAPWL